jgi:cyclopropane fatty-acyl-phospholipid synthase-like methyltransferase
VGEDVADYFAWRRIDREDYSTYRMQAYMLKVIPEHRHARILEIGCGFGQMLRELKRLGYSNVQGLDISKEAVSFCTSMGLSVEEMDVREYLSIASGKYDLIIMSHVLEHIEKEKIVDLLSAIRSGLLNRQGVLLVIVPNAQSDLGCYWAYEDFTHTTLFTSGSLYYVLRAAGFGTITFLDPDCMDGLSWGKRAVKRMLLRLYKFNRTLWNRVTTNAYHKTSEQIFSYEIKALAVAE